MIRIRNLTVKNFMSIGNATQAVNFDRGDLTLVLGENLDLGSNGSRNGTGKTTLINALSYGLYGQAISEIKVNNLVNKTNDKNMLISVEFSIDTDEFRIERGRKPAVLKFYKNGVDQDDDDAQGDSRETQKEIAHLLGISHDMFKHTIALNTYTLPFLSMRANDQKNIIEELLGITVLTEKAEALRLVLKTSKDQIKEEEFQLGALIKANEHIDDQIHKLERRHALWKRKRADTIDDLSAKITCLLEIDIDKEIQAHKDNNTARDAAKAEWYELSHKAKTEHDADLAIFLLEKETVTKHNAGISKHNAEIVACNNWIKSIIADRKINERRLQGLEKDIKLLDEHKCHACGQDLHDDKQDEIKSEKEALIRTISMEILAGETQDMEHKQTLAALGEPLEVMDVPILPLQDTVERIEPLVITTAYNTVDEAHGHKSSLETLAMQLSNANEEQDPYADQIKEMQENGLQEINYDNINEIKHLQEHQDFLLKLLTDKNSFIRKKIIEQNLAYLNSRLTYYLNEIGLPHRVRFMSDLTVEISDMGRELDFDNLSRGERNRLILSLSWAFRDVWESLYNHINLLFVDELVDNGLDTNGVEAAIKIMKGMARERGKSVWLVSHREELISRVNNTMKVIKEGGYTSFEASAD